MRRSQIRRLPPIERRGPRIGAATAARCRRICRGSKLSSISTTRIVPAARASCTGSARTRAAGDGTGTVPVLVTIRPKYACRACEHGVLQAPAPARLIEGGLPTEATVAQVLVCKYADHLPLSSGSDLRPSGRQSRSFHAGGLSRPYRLAPSPVARASSRETPPGRGRTKTGQIWAYAADDRP
jgi:hypothetical protein